MVWQDRSLSWNWLSRPWCWLLQKCGISHKIESPKVGNGEQPTNIVCYIVQPHQAPTCSPRQHNKIQEWIQGHNQQDHRTLVLVGSGHSSLLCDSHKEYWPDSSSLSSSSVFVRSFQSSSLSRWCILTVKPFLIGGVNIRCISWVDWRTIVWASAVNWARYDSNITVCLSRWMRIQRYLRLMNQVDRQIPILKMILVCLLRQRQYHKM